MPCDDLKRGRNSTLQHKRMEPHQPKDLYAKPKEDSAQYQGQKKIQQSSYINKEDGTLDKDKYQKALDDAIAQDKENFAKAIAKYEKDAEKYRQQTLEYYLAKENVSSRRPRTVYSCSRHVYRRGLNF
eukprot:COSAG05_NODE_571_length_8620_cov_4.012440_3_plen_128_part_00